MARWSRRWRAAPGSAAPLPAGRPPPPARHATLVAGGRRQTHGPTPTRVRSMLDPPGRATRDARRARRAGRRSPPPPSWQRGVTAPLTHCAAPDLDHPDRPSTSLSRSGGVRCRPRPPRFGFLPAVGADSSGPGRNPSCGYCGFVRGAERRRGASGRLKTARPRDLGWDPRKSSAEMRRVESPGVASPPPPAPAARLGGRGACRPVRPAGVQPVPARLRCQRFLAAGCSLCPPATETEVRYDGGVYVPFLT
jgi:hypothetical protein